MLIGHPMRLPSNLARGSSASWWNWTRRGRNVSTSLPARIGNPLRREGKSRISNAAFRVEETVERTVENQRQTRSNSIQITRGLFTSNVLKKRELIQFRATATNPAIVHLTRLDRK